MGWILLRKLIDSKVKGIKPKLYSYQEHRPVADILQGSKILEK
jgi:hypothetical protein